MSRELLRGKRKENQFTQQPINEISLSYNNVMPFEKKHRSTQQQTSRIFGTIRETQLSLDDLIFLNDLIQLERMLQGPNWSRYLTYVDWEGKLYPDYHSNLVRIALNLGIVGAAFAPSWIELMRAIRVHYKINTGNSLC